MSDVLKSKIETTFGRAVESYDENADIQDRVATELVKKLPSMKQPRVLEIGCGTGILTRKLFEKYPGAQFDITDISKEMLDVCSQKHPHRNATFFILDGENPNLFKTYDLIVSSMSIQWFTSPNSWYSKVIKTWPCLFFCPRKRKLQRVEKSLRSFTPSKSKFTPSRLGSGL